jgi:hypothetical protein
MTSANRPKHHQRIVVVESKLMGDSWKVGHRYGETASWSRPDDEFLKWLRSGNKTLANTDGARFRDPLSLGDWIEVMMLLSQKQEISRAQLMEALAENTGSAQQELETPISFLYAEISRRRRIADHG